MIHPVDVDFWFILTKTFSGRFLNGSCDFSRIKVFFYTISETLNPIYFTHAILILLLWGQEKESIFNHTHNLKEKWKTGFNWGGSLTTSNSDRKLTVFYDWYNFFSISLSFIKLCYLLLNQHDCFWLWIK